MISVNSLVKVLQSVEGKFRLSGEPHPDWNKVYVVNNTDGDRAIIAATDNTQEGWIVSCESLVEYRIAS